MNRLLHRQWLEEQIALRHKYKSYLHPVGRLELEELEQELNSLRQNQCKEGISDSQN